MDQIRTETASTHRACTWSDHAPFRRRTRALFVVIAIIGAMVATASVAPPVDALVLVAGEDVPVPRVSAFTVGDVFGDGGTDLVAVGDDGVFVLTRHDDADADTDAKSSWVELVSLPPLPAPATAVAIGDFIGDGVPAIAVGTAQAGTIYLLRWTGTDWTVVAQTGYLWSPIAGLVAADISGDGRAELIASDADGGVTVFSWRERTLAPVWQFPTVAGRALHVDVVSWETDGADGASRLVVADDQGRISVWQWPMTIPAAQAFVWGTPASLAVAHVSGGDPEIIVTTDERLLYRYRWDDGHLIQATSPLHDARLPFEQITPVRWLGESADRLLVPGAGDISVWAVSTSSIRLTDNGRANMPTAATQWPGTNSLLISEGDGTLSLWTRKPTDYLDFTIDGVSYVLRDAPLFQQDQVMLSARDWAEAFGLQLFWDADKQRLTVLGRRAYAIVTVDDHEVMLPAGIHQATIPPLLQSGRTYFPPEFPTWFGADYEWDPRRRALQVQTEY